MCLWGWSKNWQHQHFSSCSLFFTLLKERSIFIFWLSVIGLAWACLIHVAKHLTGAPDVLIWNEGNQLSHFGGCTKNTVDSIVHSEPLCISPSSTSVSPKPGTRSRDLVSLGIRPISLSLVLYAFWLGKQGKLLFLDPRASLHIGCANRGIPCTQDGQEIAVWKRFFIASWGPQKFPILRGARDMTNATTELWCWGARIWPDSHLPKELWIGKHARRHTTTKNLK